MLHYLFQVHRPKDHSCPLCGVQRFRSKNWHHWVMTDKTSQVSSQCSAARGGRCLPKMPWQGGGKEGRVRLHCQEPGMLELLFILRQDKPTQDSSLPWAWLALHFRRQGTCYLANRSLSTMGPELDMLSQTSLTSVACVTRSSGTWAVWCNIRFGKKHWKKTSYPSELFRTLPTMLWTKDWPFVKRRKFKTNTMREFLQR